jgi:hypothetical protein
MSRNSKVWSWAGWKGGFVPFADYLLNDGDILAVKDTGKIEDAFFGPVNVTIASQGSFTGTSSFGVIFIPSNSAFIAYIVCLLFHQG